jgi:hypothetical protein
LLKKVFPLSPIGEVDAQEKLTKNVVFFYPDLGLAILAAYSQGKMLRGTYARLKTVILPTSSSMTSDIIPQFFFETDQAKKIY